MWSPMMLSMFADAKIALKRVQVLMEAEELDFFPVTEKDSSNAILMEHGSFTWESAHDKQGREEVVPVKTKKWTVSSLLKRRKLPEQLSKAHLNTEVIELNLICIPTCNRFYHAWFDDFGT